MTKCLEPSVRSMALNNKLFLKYFTCNPTSTPMKNFNTPTLSVCCITYNHEDYISETLEGFLMQKTNFDFEILIGEDCSTDNTRKIIQSYCEKYPNKVKLITSENNVGAINNQVRVLSQAKGKYIAMCDGDDFWIDPLKLQKQVDILDKDEEVVICCNYTRVVDSDGKIVYEAPGGTAYQYTYQDLLAGNREETRICSAVIRNSPEFREMIKSDWYFKTYGTDVFMKLYMTAHTGGKIYVLPDIMTCYRLHTGGIYSMVNPKVRKHRMLSDFNILVNNFPYSSHQKRQLLRKYLREFFLFELRNSNPFKVVNTLSSLI